MSSQENGEDKKKGILTFEEGMNDFHCWGKMRGLFYLRMLSINILLDDERIGYIIDDGKVTVSGHATVRDPSTITSYSNAFTLSQWLKIGERAEKFAEMCVRREVEFADTFKRLEDLARRMFPEDGPFGHLEIVKMGSKHIVLGGGKGEWKTYSSGIYIYDDAPYQGEEVKIGYRPVEEHRITKAVELEEEMLLQLRKAASSIDTLEG